MDQSEHTAPTEVVIVSANADITLVVGPDKKQIRVQSAFLKETSKPFAAMLSERWKDPDTKVIELPEDDADAMVQICIAPHQHYAELSADLSPATVLEVAIIADKYLPLEALGCVASRYWLRSSSRKIEFHGLVGMLQYATAAWVFHDAEAFWSHTRSLIVDWNDSYIVEKGTRLDTFMNRAIPVALEEQRAAIKFRLLRIPIEELRGEDCRFDCGWAARQALSNLNRLRESDEFDMGDFMGVSHISKALYELPPPVRDVAIRCSGETCHGLHDKEAWHKRLCEPVSNDIDRLGGLCLLCCKLERWTDICPHLRWRTTYSIQES